MKSINTSTFYLTVGGFPCPGCITTTTTIPATVKYNTGCLLPWRIIRSVVLPIIPGGPFYVCKLVLVFVGKQPLIPVRRIVLSSPGLVVQGSTEVRRHGVLRSSLPASHAQATPKQSILGLRLVPGACYVRNTTT